MSRDIRPNRPGAGAFPSKAPSRFEEYDDEYPSRNRYHSDDYPAPSGRSSDARRGPVNNGRYDQTTSGSSAGSTLLERMKNKNHDYSGRGVADDEYDSPREQKATWARNTGGSSLRTQRADRQAPRDESRVANDPGSAGNTLWGRVVSAAGSLTINVSKAWDSNAHDGPETPPGGETRLTKVMKEYYLQRARAPVDLPHWLFEEHERMPTRPPPREKIAQNGGRSDRGRYDEDYGDEYARPQQPPQQSRGALRDVYEKAASKPASTRSTPASSAYDSTASTGESKAASRLRAMREAKRGNISGASAYTPSKYDVDYDDGGAAEPPRQSGGNRSRW